MLSVSLKVILVVVVVATIHVSMVTDIEPVLYQEQTSFAASPYIALHSVLSFLDVNKSIGVYLVFGHPFCIAIATVASLRHK